MYMWVNEYPPPNPTQIYMYMWVTPPPPPNPDLHVPVHVSKWPPQPNPTQIYMYMWVPDPSPSDTTSSLSWSCSTSGDLSTSFSSFLRMDSWDSGEFGLPSSRDSCLCWGEGLDLALWCCMRQLLTRKTYWKMTSRVLGRLQGRLLLNQIKQVHVLLVLNWCWKETWKTL